MMLPTIIFGQIYCGSSQRAYEEKQEQSLKASYEQRQLKTSITLENLSYFHDLLTAELRDYDDLIKFLNMSKT